MEGVDVDEERVNEGTYLSVVVIPQCDEPGLFACNDIPCSTSSTSLVMGENSLHHS